MRSSRPARLRAQSGQSLVEALVASAILGLGVVTAITALDTTVTGASEATRQAAATCAVRAEAGMLEAATWEDNQNVGRYPTLNNVAVRLAAGSPGNGLQVLDITARDSAGRVLATGTVYKAIVLSQGTPPQNALTMASPGEWCSYVTRAAP
jgi:Tfp pilus assembly protein PilV